MNAHIIIVAAGSGSRFGSVLPKQYCLLAGRPVLMHSIERMRSAMPGAGITLVISGAMVDLWRGLCAEHGFRSPRIVFGGATRSESVRNALFSLDGDYDIILVHDGARPLVDVACVKEVVAAMSDEDVDGAIPAVPVTDSLRVVRSDGTSGTVNRTCYRAVQTPQAFRADKLIKAYSSVKDSFSDDASLMEQSGYNRIVLTVGSPANIKITNPMDIAIAEHILSMKQG